MITDPRLIPLRDALLDAMIFCPRPADGADALLAPDGPLWPLLRAFGSMAVEESRNPRDWLLAEGSHYALTGPLADACLAAAEVER